MTLLVFNSGSSSLKFRTYTRAPDGALQPETRGAITRIGRQASWRWKTRQHETAGHADLADHGQAAGWVLTRLRAEEPAQPIEAVGHRVVHGGEIFKEPVLLTAANIARLEAISHLAPLHNPLALQVIHACRHAFGPGMPMTAVFDTAFHSTLAPAARAYALPRTWVEALGIRRYGFHGLAHRYMYERYREITDDARTNRLVTFQLGNGCSVCAIRDGRSVDTSMGYTPLEGLIMSTRSGDTDPGALVRILASGVEARELEQQLNQTSGLLALSGETGDMQTLLSLQAQGHAGAMLAVETFCHRARKYLGAYLAILGGAEAILFGGGIGENAPAIRARICAGMEWCGLQLDANANAGTRGTEAAVSGANSPIAAHVINVEEELLIARDTAALLAARS
jgi:acetate kinase